MKTVENYDAVIANMPDEVFPQYAPRQRSHGKLLLVGGVLGVLGAGFILAAPELGFASALGGALAGIGSAGVTMLARK